MNRDPAFGDIDAVAAFCNVSRRTVSRWMRAGLKHYKPTPNQQGHVLIKWADVDAWLEKHAVERKP